MVSNIVHLTVAVLLVQVVLDKVLAFQLSSSGRIYSRRPPSLLFSRSTSSNNNKKNSDDDAIEVGDLPGTAKDMDRVTKSAWYGVELFGKVFGKASEKGIASSTAPPTIVPISTEAPPKSLEETIQRIGMDNDRSYFLSGNVDVQIYDKECVFADPFVSFSGRDRFVTNLANLGSFITQYDAKVIKYSPVIYRDQVPTIETKIMVKLELNLPWRPILAWPWGVTYEIDPQSYLVTQHTESWDIEPMAGVKQIFRKPTLKV
jgi:hypothetical protein